MSRFIGFTLKTTTNAIIQSKFVQQCRFYHKYSKVRFTAADSLDYMIQELEATIYKFERIPIQNIDEVIRRVPHGITQSQSIALLGVFRQANCARHKDEVMMKLWSELNKNKHLLNEDHFKEMLRYYSFTGNAQDAQTMFNKLTAIGYNHNSKSYQHLIGAYANAGDLAKVNELVNTMIDKRLYLTDKVYNYCVQCHLKIGDVAGAFAMWDELKSQGVHINKNSLRAFCQHYAQIGNLNKLKYILDRCGEERAEDLSWLTLMSINDLAEHGYVDHVGALISRLETTLNLAKSLKHSIEYFVRDGNGALIVDILKSTDVDKPEIAKYLINELVLQERNADEINEIWEHLTLIGLSIERNFDVYQAGYNSQSIDLIEKVLQYMHAHGMEIKDHMFRQWIILSAKLYKDHMLRTIGNISDNFNFRPTSAFIQDTILPLMNWKTDPLATLAQLHKTLPEQCRHNCNVAIINTLLNDNDIRRAYGIAEVFKTHLIRIEVPLIRAYHHSQDTDNFVRFIRLIFDRMSKSNLPKLEVLDKQNQFIENIVNLIIADSEMNTDTKVICLSTLAERGFFISEKFAEKTIEQLRKENVEISKLLRKLSKQTDEIRAALQIFPGDYDTMTSDQIANVLKVKTMYGQQPFQCMKKLLRAYLREDNIKGIESLRANKQIILSSSNYAQLIQFYVKRRNASTTMQLLNDAYINFGPLPEFYTKALDIIELMTNHLRTMDNVDIFYGKQEHNKNIESSHGSSSFILEPLFTEHILKRQDLRATNTALDLIGSIMSVHLKQAQPSKAVDLFENMVKSFKIVAIPDILLNTLITLNEQNLLQRVKSTLETVRGEDHTQIAVAFAYIECSQPQNAKNMFQCMSSDTVGTAIARKCRLYSRQNRMEAMEYLLEATNGLSFDRSIIYESLLDIYVDANFIDKALQLHQTYLMDKQLAPTNQFLQTINKLRQRNSIDVPS